MKSKEWHELAKITGGEHITIEKIRMTEKEISIEGSFELPPLARLSAEDQVFVMAFVRADGSIKEMERIFGVSYPTIKNRLNRVAMQLQLVEIIPFSPNPDNEVLTALERGDISAKEAIERLSK